MKIVPPGKADALSRKSLGMVPHMMVRERELLDAVGNLSIDVIPSDDDSDCVTASLMIRTR